MQRTIASVMLGDGRSQLAVEVLPGEKLQFTGGQAHFTDHYDPVRNEKIALTLLRTPGLIIMPTARSEEGWEDWWPGWIAKCGDNQPCRAEVIYPGGQPAKVDPPAQQSINIPLVVPGSVGKVAPIVKLSWDELEAERVSQAIEDGYEPQAPAQPRMKVPHRPAGHPMKHKGCAACKDYLQRRRVYREAQQSAA